MTVPTDLRCSSWARDQEVDPVGTAGCHTEVAGTDLLIRGHGRRDRCCGALGTALHLEAAVSGRLPADVRVWRTSHTGGHPFAPTAIVLPEGTCWGYLDASALSGIVSRSEPLGSYRHQYRGCTGMSSPAVQAAEHAVLGEIGWDLFDRPRSGGEAADGTVTLSVRMGEGRRTWRGRVVVKRTLPVPNCGVAVSDTERTDDELAVTELHELPRNQEVPTP
jgi:hypothetical protein